MNSIRIETTPYLPTGRGESIVREANVFLNIGLRHIECVACYILQGKEDKQTLKDKYQQRLHEVF